MNGLNVKTSRKPGRIRAGVAAAVGTALLTGALQAPAPASAATVPPDACPTPTMPYESWTELLGELRNGADQAVFAAKGVTYRLVREQAGRRTVTTVTHDWKLRRRLTRYQVTSADGATVLSDSRQFLFFNESYGEGDLGLFEVRRQDPPRTPLDARKNGALKRLGKTRVWIAYGWEDPDSEDEYRNEADQLDPVGEELYRAAEQGPVSCVVAGDTITLSASNATLAVSARLTVGAHATGPAVVSTILTVDDTTKGRTRYLGSADYTRTALAKPKADDMVSAKKYYRAHLAGYLALYSRTVRDEAAADVRKASTVKKRVAALRAHAKSVNKRLLKAHTPAGDTTSAFGSKRNTTARGVTYTVWSNYYLPKIKGKVTFTVKGKKIVSKVTLS